MFSHGVQELDIERPLFPATQVREEGDLKVSDLHTLHYAVYGNPHGIPVVMLHGGPGMGYNEGFPRYFDPEKWNIVMFDQRGAMRSKPFGCMEENTSQDLVEDIEKLRNHLKIEKWLVFGGSWGSTLGLLYGQAYPEKCLGFILRGVFLGRAEDAHQIMYGMGKIFPEAYDELLTHFTEEEKKDLLGTCYRRSMDPDPAVHLPIIRAFIKYDLICSTHLPNPTLIQKIMENNELALSCARAYFYYTKNNYFLRPNQILSEMKKISHLPAIIVQGRWDAICLPDMAYQLYKRWEKNCDLWIMTKGGHSANDPGIAPGLVEATTVFAQQLSQESGA